MAVNLEKKDLGGDDCGLVYAAYFQMVTRVQLAAAAAVAAKGRKTKRPTASSAATGQKTALPNTLIRC